jgi:hypothetical protein
MSNDPPRDLAESNRPRTSLTRRHWLYAFLWIVAGSGILLVLRNKYHRHQRRVARNTLGRLGAGGGLRNADGGWLVSSEGRGRFDDPEHYNFIILRGKEVTDADLACLPPLTNIEWLDLSETQISDDGLRHLKAMPQLRWLNLKKTHATDAGIAALREALEHTEIVD